MIIGRTRKHEAERQYGDPWPFHTPSGRTTTMAERLARVVRHKRKARIAIGQTKIPPGWAPHPSYLSAMYPQADKTGAAIAHWIGFTRWKAELRVGSLAGQAAKCIIALLLPLLSCAQSTPHWWPEPLMADSARGCYFYQRPLASYNDPFGGGAKVIIAVMDEEGFFWRVTVPQREMDGRRQGDILVPMLFMP